MDKKPHYRRTADGATVFMGDGMRNALTGLGGAGDKGAANRHVLQVLNDYELYTVYSSSWLAKQIIDIPADDATKKWRRWQGEGGDAVSALEVDLGVQNKIKTALIRSRLFGGAAVMIGTAATDYDEPLDPETIGQGDLQFLTVIDRLDLSAGKIVDDPTNPLFGKPADYSLTTSTNGIVKIHPTRLASFHGVERPARAFHFDGWGFSELQACIDAIRHMDGAMADLSMLLKELKIDVLKVPGLTDLISDPQYEAAIKARLAVMQRSIGNHNKVILDKEEEFSTNRHGFDGVAATTSLFMQVVCGAADIPMTRLFGQSPGGLNSTGDGDLRNYYDNVAARQRNTIGAATRILDRCLVRSALGDEPDDIKPEWVPLREMTELERADIANKNADTGAKLAAMSVFDDLPLAEAMARLMEESGVEGLEPLDRIDEVNS